MKYVREKRGALGYYFDIDLDNIHIRQIKVYRVKKEINRYTYLLLLDSNGKVIKQVFNYLNIFSRGEKENNRDQILSALKILYSFQELIEKEVSEFDRGDVILFSNFVKGRNYTGINESIEFISERSNTTYNTYFDIIRRYLTFCNKKNDYFFEKVIVYVTKNGFGFMSHTNTVKVEKFKTNKSNSSNKYEYVPKYINVDEYAKIYNEIKAVNNEFQLRNLLLIDCLFKLGLRIGEVLGLTFEDIKQNSDYKEAGYLILRNRTSDRKYQSAKGCMKVETEKDYQLGSYNTRDEGFQIVDLTPILMRRINEYIDDTRNIFSLTDKRIENLKKHAIADSVEKGTNENFYLFLNKNFTPLSSSGWSKFLKQIYKNVGIKTDIGTKKDNLSHRFRHGYAMFLIDEMNYKIEQVKTKMRHKSIMSTLIYYNPRPKDTLKDTILIEESIDKKLGKGNCDTYV